MKFLRISVVFSLILLLSFSTSNAATGNLGVSMSSLRMFSGVVPGDTVIYSIIYYWQGDDQATNVVLKDNLPAEMDLLSVYPLSTSQSGNSLTWQLGTLNNAQVGSITVIGIVKNNVDFGTVITNTATISSSDNDTEPGDNEAVVELTVKPPLPDLWTFQWGLLESMESGIYFTAEIDVPVSFDIYYGNMSYNTASGAVLTDSLPDGLEFISADPSPSSVNGNVLTWNLGDLDKFASGHVVLKLKPTSLGDKKISADISSTAEDEALANNASYFSFSVVSVLQPIILKPLVTYFDSETPLIMPSNPKFSGMAKAGATVTLYEGDSSLSFGDLSLLNPKEIGSAVVGADRRWEIVPTAITEGRNYHLYIQAEFNGEKSAPFLNLWQPITIRIDPIFDSAGFDMDHFVIQTGDQEVYPGAFGGRSGTTPNEDIIIKKRFKAPPSILTDTTMWKNHEMKLVITENGETYEKILPLSEVRSVTGNKIVPGINSLNKKAEYVTYDFIYVQKGFGPGAKVEVWCRPIYYSDSGVPLVGLVFVKCHEILIDPAGYVYDTDIAGQDYEWPAVPPEKSLIKNATITAMTRTGDDSWERWKAEETGQVNPQVTDSTTGDGIFVPGYYAFYVPAGQYQVNASAPDYVDYVSPILTVVDEPIFHNVGMKKAAFSVTGVENKSGGKNNYSQPQDFALEQNYPNPFNPVTTIGYILPVAGKVTLKIYNTLGKEIATLLNGEYKEAGRHLLMFDASSLPSGVYFYRIIAGKFSMTKKSVLIK